MIQVIQERKENRGLRENFWWSCMCQESRNTWDIFSNTVSLWFQTSKHTTPKISPLQGSSPPAQTGNVERSSFSLLKKVGGISLYLIDYSKDMGEEKGEDMQERSPWGAQTQDAAAMWHVLTTLTIQLQAALLLNFNHTSAGLISVSPTRWTTAATTSLIIVMFSVCGGFISLSTFLTGTLQNH